MIASRLLWAGLAGFFLAMVLFAGQRAGLVGLGVGVTVTVVVLVARWRSARAGTGVPPPVAWQAVVPVAALIVCAIVVVVALRSGR